MRAIRFHEPGPSGVLRLEKVEVPEPGPGEVTIDVAYAGVGFVDTLMRNGTFSFLPRPTILGLEVSGRIRSLGAGVSGLVPGQRVVALLTDSSNGLGAGGYAEVARAKAALTLPLSPGTDLALAAAVAVNGATAWLAVEIAGVSLGSVVGISGAAGGLGRALIAAATTARAGRIIGLTGNPARQGELLLAGAHAALVTGDGNGPLEESGLDAAFDSVGGPLRQRLLSSLKPGGRLIILGNASGNDAPLSGDEIWIRGLRVEGFATGGISHLWPERVAAAARTALAVMAQPGLTRKGLAVVELSDAAKAHEALERREGPGKFVLRVSDGMD